MSLVCSYMEIANKWFVLYYYKEIDRLNHNYLIADLIRERAPPHHQPNFVFVSIISGDYDQALQRMLLCTELSQQQ